jgi:hypothetical protein
MRKISTRQLALSCASIYAGPPPGVIHPIDEEEKK